MTDSPEPKELDRVRPMPRRRFRLGAVVLASVAFLLVGGVVGWAATVVLAPPRDVVSNAGFTFVTVADGEVGSSLNFNTVAEWTTEPVAANLISGTVTSVNISSGQEVTHGTTLYTVDLRPVAVAQGSIPAFRTLQQGDEGADVAQLQQFLAIIGTYEDAIDGEFDYSTSQAVRDWQKLVGIEPDGTIQAGDLVYVPSLPARIALDTEKVRVGASVSAGDQVVLGLPLSPAFRIPLTANQSTLVPLGTRVVITGPGGQAWEGFAAEQKQSETGVDILLAPGDDQTSICRDECAQIPISEEVSLRSQIVVVESVQGLTVPSAALSTRADGATVVIDEDGLQHAVQVIASAKGTSVVEGVPAGMQVRVPATE